MMCGVRSVAELGMLAGGTLCPDRLEINRREDGVLRFGAARGSFLEQGNGRLAAARAMKNVDIQVRHGRAPVVARSICFATTVVADQAANIATPTHVESAPQGDANSLRWVVAR